jgi:VanZ family protein
MRLRPWLAAASLVFLAFAWYGSLVPLQLRYIPLHEAVERFRTAQYVPLSAASRTDLVTNVLLMVPFGFTLAGALSARSRGLAIIAVPLVGACAGALGAAIELSQVFTPDRTPSWNDVVAQGIGGLTGAALWLAAGTWTTDFLTAVFTAHSAEDRALRLLTVYAVAWFAVGVLPLDFTLRPAEIAEKLRAGHIVLTPWPPLASVDDLADAAATLLWAVPLGAFGLLMSRRHPQAALPGTLVGVLLVGALEGFQLLLMSRWAKVHDVTVGALGVAIGAYAAARILGPARGSLRPGPELVRVWPLAALAAWTVVLAFRHWAPFDFSLEGAFVRPRLQQVLEQVPFESYYWGNPLDRLGDATTKVLMGVPVGVFLRLLWTPAYRLAALLAWCALLVVGVALFGAIELGQVFLPSRFPDLTDVLIGTAGVLAGGLVVRLLTGGTSHRKRRPADARG